MLLALPCDSANLTESTAHVVEDVERPAVDAHGIVHVVDKSIKELHLILQDQSKLHEDFCCDKNLRMCRIDNSKWSSKCACA